MWWLLLLVILLIYVVITGATAYESYSEYETVKLYYEKKLPKHKYLSLGIYDYDHNPEDYYTAADVQRYAREVLLSPLWPLEKLQEIIQDIREFILDLKGFS